MSQIAVRRALEKHLAIMPSGIETAAQNVVYAPRDGVPYQRVTLMPATPDNTVAGDSYFERGVFEVQLMYPGGLGPSDAEAQAHRVRAHFKRSTTLTEGGVNVLVMTTPTVAQGMPVGGRFAVPVSVTYQAQINP